MQQYIIDTFTKQLFHGNPAAVCLVERWPEEDLMLKIARENAQSHTAFVLPLEGSRYQMRWFTPSMEINICGHATLAAAYVITRFVCPDCTELVFETLSGPLTVIKKGDLFQMDFPAYTLKQLEVTDAITEALGARPADVWRARDLVCIFDDPAVIRTMQPDLDKIKQLKGALMQVTAPGDGEFDCVSRTFGPKMNMPEDPVCGSGHCHIIPYWAAQTGKTQFTAQQASPRGGVLYCRLEGDRVLISGEAVLYSSCNLALGDLL